MSEKCRKLLTKPKWSIPNPNQERSTSRLVYAEYIMRNTGLDEAQAGIKIAGRNISNLRYTDDTTFMIESEEELENFLMKVKEESENAGYETQH